jgi:hypothetical protein
VTVALAKAEHSAERASRQRTTTSMEALAVLADWKEAAASLAEAEAASKTGAAPDGLDERVAEMRQRIESGMTKEEREEKLFIGPARLHTLSRFLFLSPSVPDSRYSFPGRHFCYLTKRGGVSLPTRATSCAHTG